MNETRRTVTYVIAAAVLALVAWKLSPPVEITPQELVAAKIGTEFWPEFKDPNAPTSIRVVAVNEATARPQSFGVKFENGKWTIPSHHNYPADGADRLAKTAASVMHIKREEIASDSDQNDEKLGVVDPLDEDTSKLKGRGKRITLSQGDNTLVDLIIGKEVKDRPGFFYIRKPGEKMTYVAKLKIDLSTKFADWVETDLLKIDRNDLKEIVINDYSIDEANGRLVAGNVSKLTRDKSADPWKLDGLDDAKEELDTSKVSALVGALDDLRLVGVRPKPKGLRPDLTLDPEFLKRQSDVELLLIDMQRKGFILLQDKKRQMHLYSNEGELAAATNKGVVYTLQFGEIFTGDESEIEIGSSAEGDADANDKKDKKKGDEPEGKDKAKSKDSAGKQPSRYLFVTTHFDEQYLGQPPEEPEEIAASGNNDAGAPRIKPKKSQKTKPAPDADDTDESSSSPEAKVPQRDEGDEKPVKSEDECGPPSAVDDESEPAADEKDEDENKNPAPGAKDAKDETEKSKDEQTKDEKPKKSSDDLKKEYEAKHKKYEADLKAYEDKVAEGKKLVDELNARFGDWYYVISADNFNKLHLSRKELVKDKGKPAGAAKDESKEDKPSDSDDGKGEKTTEPDEEPDTRADDPDEK